MPQKTIKKKFSAKGKPPQGLRSAGTTPRRSAVPPAEEDFFAKAFRLSPHPIGITEVQTGRCLEINDACLEIFGFQRDEVIGQTTLMLGIWPDPQERVRFLDRLKAEGKVRDVEVPMRMKDGELRRFIISTDLITLRGKLCLLTIGNDITERKQAEEALRQFNATLELRVAERTAALYESNTRLQGMLDHSPSTIFMKDLQGRYVDVNTQFEQTFHLMRQDVIGKTDHDVFPPEYAAAYRANDLEVLKAGRSLQFEEVALHDDGLHTNIVWKCPLRRLDGTMYAMCGIVTDITERKRAEAALHTVEARQRVLLKSAPVVLYSSKVTGDYGATFVSENVVEQLGHRPEDFTDDPEFWVNHIHPDDRSRILVGLSTIFGSDRHEHEYRFLRKDGTYCWLHDEVRVIRDEAGVPQEMIGFQVDISQRKEAEGQLQQSERRLNQAIHLAKLGIFDHDHRTETLYWSPMMREIYGIPSDEPASLDGYIQLIHPHDRDAIVGAIRRAHDPSGDGLYSVEHRLLRRDGSVRWVSFRSRTLFEGDGPTRKPVHTVGAMMDITERKQAEEALHQKQRELLNSQVQLQDLTAKLFTAQDSERQRIARDLHDDFSQRLTALVLDVAAFERHPPLSPELIGKALEPVREELTQLSADLHNLAYKLHPPLLRHAGLQVTIEDYIQKAIERTGLRITLKAKDLPDSVPLDWSTCLFRVFQEGLQNVVKHARATEVLVKLSGSSKGIGLSVIDNGKGFDARDKSGHQKGMGLISMQERLRLLNGFLNIHSRPADGTKVCAWIPFQEKTP